MSNNLVSKALLDRLAAVPAIVALLAEDEDGDPAIYEDQAPQDSEGPFILISSPASNPQESLGDAIAWEEMIYNVKAVTDGGSAKIAGDLQVLIDQALTGSALTITGRQQILLRRVSGISYPENDDGRTWRHRGASYEIWFN